MPKQKSVWHWTTDIEPYLERLDVLLQRELENFTERVRAILDEFEVEIQAKPHQHNSRHRK